MVVINRLHISPPLINSSCAWASDEDDLRDLFNCEFTGAVTTRTATLNGFAEDTSIHTVAFSAESISSVNSFGYSPHPLSQYLSWAKALLPEARASRKPVIISITSSKPDELNEMVKVIQQLRSELSDADGEISRVGIELNTSCPNIEGAPPPAYDPDSLRPLLAVLARAFWSDRTLTVGLKLPPYVYATQFTDVLSVIADLSREVEHTRYNPIGFLTCTNTLGTSLLFADQTTDARAGPAEGPFALPTPLGGLAGESIHALSLGNVYTFSRLLGKSTDPALQKIAIVGVGGITSPEAVQRMRTAGARVVACATFLGREGVTAFSKLSSTKQL